MNKNALLTLTLSLAALCAARPAAAMDSKAGTGAGAFMKLGLGAPRAQALGHAASALVTGTEAMAWNVGGMAYTSAHELGVSHLSWVQDYKANYFAYVHPIGRTVLGVNVGYLSLNDFDARDVNNIPQPNDSVSVSNSFMSLNIARSFLWDSLALGAGVKRVTENNNGTEYSNVVFDVGAQFKPWRKLAFGAAVQNIGDSAEVVRIQRLGAALLLNSYFTLSGEIEKASDNRARAGFGLEATLPEDMLQVGKFSLRAGYYDNDDMGRNYDDSMMENLGLQKSSKLSFGVGLMAGDVFGYSLALDYTFVPMGALGKASQIMAKVQF